MGSIYNVKRVNGGISLIMVKTLFSSLLFFSSMNVLEPIDPIASYYVMIHGEMV